MTKPRLALLGLLRLSIHGQSHVLSSPSSAALLGYLALSTIQGRLVSRATLANSLWPQVSEVQARRNLTEAIYRLRQAFDDRAPWLLVDQHTLRLEGVALDILEFRILVASEDLQDWRAALDLYTGDLIEGIDADWLIEKRVWFRDQYLVTLARVCTALAQAGCYSESLIYADRWVLADPLNEDAHRAVMRINARLGRHAVALEQYDKLVRQLEEDLQAYPLPETRALANAIRAEYRVAEDLHPPATTVVGRCHERAALLRRVERAQEGDGGIVLIEGEPGIGKTHLLQAIGQGAAWRGVAVAWGTVAGNTSPEPYAPLTTALAHALDGPRAEQLRQHVPEPMARIIDELAPRLASSSAVGGPMRSDGTPGTHLLPSNLADELGAHATLAGLLVALAELTPCLLILDDVQRADVQFWRALQMCVPLLSGQRLLLILSYRNHEMRSNPDAWRILRGIDRDFAPLLITLKPLSPDDCTRLARELGVKCRTDVLDLHRKTGGNPLLVRELLGAPDSSPYACLRQIFDQRLARLTPAARKALEAAAVLGQHFSYAQWFALVRSGVVGVIPLLLAEHCIQETDHGYQFAHDLFREHLYELIAPQRRQALHRRAAEALVRERAAPERVAWQYARAGALAEAVGYYCAAAECAERAAAYATAAQYYERALELLDELPQSEAERRALGSRRLGLAAILDDSRSTDQAIHTVVRLPKIGAPLGKALGDGDRLQIRWTVDAGRADAAILLDSGKVALRRHRIARLVEEAYTYGAVPTESDLARVLGVTERTIVADVAAIRASGSELLTRRYKPK